MSMRHCNKAISFNLYFTAKIPGEKKEIAHTLTADVTRIHS